MKMWREGKHALQAGLSGKSPPSCAQEAASVWGGQRCWRAWCVSTSSQETTEWGPVYPRIQHSGYMLHIYWLDSHDVRTPAGG